MKPLLHLLFVLVLALPSVSRATLVTIGSGQMAPHGPTYKLIWDSDNNGQSLVWLDYTGGVHNNPAFSSFYVNGVNAALTYTVEPNYRLTWIDAAWRLPSPGAAPYWCQCATTSELGHLFYVELGLKAPLRDAANPYNNLTVEELNVGEFDNLIPGVRYSQSPYFNSHFWYFDMGAGISWSASNWTNPGEYAGIAVRAGRVSLVSPVPEPPTVVLMAAALLALVPATLRRHRRH
jgi:hypothetical protein